MKTQAKNNNGLLDAMADWFTKNHAEIRHLMIYVPRTTRTTEKRGASFGCADLIILCPNKYYHSLCIQVLGNEDRDSVCHKRWRILVGNEGNKCVAVRDLIGFVREVELYFIDTPYE